MNVFDFITREELDNLPDEPRLAFVDFVGHAERRLAAATDECVEHERWKSLEDARHSFMNIVIAAAKRYSIEPFTATEVPRLSKFTEDNYRQFKADLDHYLTQLLLDNAIRGRQDSVVVPQKSKDRIRNYLHALRECVEKSNLAEAKKSRLLDKLDAFEIELEKRRLSLLTATRVTLELLALPGGVWTSAEIAQKLVTNVLQAVGEAKVAEDEARQLPSSVPATLSAPRHQEALPALTSSGDLNDDIPF